MTADFVELRTNRPSLLLRLLTWLFSTQPPPFPLNEASTRELLGHRDEPVDAPMPKSFERRFQIERFELEGQQCVTMHPRSGPGRRHILYLHGGGFILPMLDPLWPLAAALVETTGASLTLPLYKVVPEASYNAAESLADAAFARIAGQWESSAITLAGDSAGANMAIALALRLLRRGGPQAGRVVLFSPWLDITLRDEAARVVEANDIMLRIDALRVMGEAWAGSRDPACPACSPLYVDPVDLAHLPPIAIFQGRHDIFVVDSRSFAKRAAEAGKPVKLYEYAGAMHDFMVLTMTREAKDCMRLVREFIAE